jgi:hypothetical protein
LSSEADHEAGMAIPSTTERVSARTSTKANVRIAQDAEARVRWHAAHPESIPERLRTLEREWDVERVLEANAASLSLLGLALGRAVDRRFYLLPAAVATFLLQHAIQGWCPPLPILRRLGVRTQSEIDEERYAPKALRGDFRAVARDGNEALAAARADGSGH